MKKIFILLSIILILSTASACDVKDIPEVPTEPQIDAKKFDVKYFESKELSQEEKLEFSEYLIMDILLASPISLADLIDDSYSIITAELKSVEQDEKIKNLRFYEFEIETLIKGNADNLSSIRLEIYDYAFGETSINVIYKDDGYSPPYDIGGRYLLFIGKHQYVYAKNNKIEYYLNMNAFSLLEGNNIKKLMQQTHPHKGTYPKDMDSFKGKIASIVDDTKENGMAHGSDFIDSRDIKAIADFAPIIIEVRKKSKADTEASSVTDIYQMELVKIHKGELCESIRIFANAKNGLGEGDDYLLFLSESQGESYSYYLASPDGSVISVADTEKYNKAMKYIYPEEEKTGLLEFIKAALANLFK